MQFERRQFIRLLTLLPFLKANAGLARILGGKDALPYTEKMPVFFVGHQDFSKSPHLTPFTKNLREMGSSVKPSPAAILVISAHWQSLGNTYVSTLERFNTQEYQAPGAPDAARIITEKTGASGDDQRQLDHGAWSVLRHISPKGDLPVLELSIDMARAVDRHYQIARQLSELRNRGVLIIGSGNIVHNLEMSAIRFWTSKPYDWAIEFDEWAKRRIDERDFSSLFQYYKLGKVANYAVPTMDHYLPLLYCLSLYEQGEAIEHTYSEVSRGLSFRCLRIG